MSRADTEIRKFLTPGSGPMWVGASGRYVFVKEAALPIFVRINQSTQEMRAGDKWRIDGVFDGIEIDNRNPSGVQVVLAVGNEDFNSQIVTGSIRVIEETRTLSGPRPRRFSTVNVSLALPPGASFEPVTAGNVVAAYPIMAGDSYQFVAIDPRDERFGYAVAGTGQSSRLVKISMDSGAQVASLSEGAVGVDQFRRGGIDAAGNYLAVHNDVDGTKAKVFSLAMPKGSTFAGVVKSTLIDSPYLMANYPGGTPSEFLTFWGASPTPDGKKALLYVSVKRGSSTFHEALILDTQTMTVSEAPYLKSGAGGEVRCGVVGQRLLAKQNGTNIEIYNMDSGALVKSFAAPGQGSPYYGFSDFPHWANNGQMTASNTGGGGKQKHIRRIEPVDIDAVLYGAGEVDKCGASSRARQLFKRELNARRTSAAITTATTGSNNTLSGEVIRAALELWTGAPVRADYLDLIFGVELIGGGQWREIATPNESFLVGGVADNFALDVPGNMTLTVDDRWWREGVTA